MKRIIAALILLVSLHFPALAQRQPQLSEFRVYQAKEGGAIGCQNPGILPIVREGRPRITEAQWNRAMDAGMCFPAILGVDWIRSGQHEGPHWIMRLIPTPYEGPARPSIFLWFHEDDMPDTGRTIMHPRY